MELKEFNNYLLKKYKTNKIFFDELGSKTQSMPSTTTKKHISKDEKKIKKTKKNMKIKNEKPM